MLTYPAIDPVAVSIAGIKIHWYGLMYLIGFAGTWLLGQYRANTQSWSPVTAETVEDIVTYGAMGVILGGRTGYVLFYDTSHFLADPLLIFKIWQGGMSFHGGMIGVLLVMAWLGKKHHCSLWQLSDFITPMVPIGLGAGRIGNFINSELWGKPTDVPWAMVFPNGGPLARHPSQLYEAFLEGVVLFVVLWLFSQKQRPTMAVTGLGMGLYGVFRFIVEFVRVPDAQLGYLALDWLTMGQILSTPMIVGGGALIIWAYRRNAKLS